MSAPVVSVLMPVYNSEKYLADAVQSIRYQTFSDFELLALDDGSTDSSLLVLRMFERMTLGMKVFPRENRGLATSLNELAAHATGKYLARMDADDVAHPERLAKQVAFLEANPDCVAVGSHRYTMTAGGLPVGPVRLPLHHEEIDAHNLRGFCSMVHPSVVMRADAFKRVGGYDETLPLAQDLDLWLRLAEVGKLANLNEDLIAYRVHNGAASEARLNEQRACAERACAAAWQRRGIPGRYEATTPWRPGADTRSQHRFALSYGWQAWANGHDETWWHFARKAFGLRPLHIDTWRLAVFGAIRRPPLTDA